MSIEVITIDQRTVFYRVVTMPGDGACLFHSLSYLLHGHILLSLDIRRNIVSHVLDDWERFKVWSDDGTGDNYTTHEHYKSEMLKPFTFGSACELIAAAELFGCRFQVYRNGQIFYTFGQPPMPLKRLRFTGNDLSRGHFDVYESLNSQNQASKLLMKPVVCLQRLTEAECHVNTPSLRITNVIVTENESQTDCEDNTAPYVNPVKRRRVKRRGRFSDAARRKQLRDAAVKYLQKNPQVHRDAVSKYSQANPQVNRDAVSKYSQANPQVHRDAVSKYSQANPQVNRESVSRYDPSNDKRLKRKQNVWLKKADCGFAYDSNLQYESDKTVNIGSMNVECEYCQAIRWKCESPGLCCNGGKVSLTHLHELPDLLEGLLNGEHPQSEHFLNNIRKYNSAFQMTSFGANRIVEGNFMPSFKVQGQVYHLIGSLLPMPTKEHTFLQIYFVGDDEKETQMRCANVSGLNTPLVQKLQKMLHECNTYIQDFQSALDSMSETDTDFKVVINADKKPLNAHKGRFNKPTVREVGVVIVGQAFENRDIVLKSRDNKLQRIKETHRSYDALQYPLMFCYGEDGYSVSIPQVHAVSKLAMKKTVSAANFYSYRLMIKKQYNNTILYYRALLNQFLVDMYAKIETERLNFIRLNQKKLRAEQYIHLKDAIDKNDTNLNEIGQAVILPSSFTGGPRYMHERTQDAMTYVRHYGRPDLFITFTCNPKWTDITNVLLPRQKPHDRHDLISRVFHLKIRKMMDLLTKSNIFGCTTCYMYTIEWQKRGLPHAHILLWLKNRIRPAVIDQVICAELPDPQTDPSLYEIVKSTMIHGPCGPHNIKSPCMINGTCSRKFPRPFISETQAGENGYPQYRRRAPGNGGHTANINGEDIDNRWVVPYNPVLSRFFNAHINVEFCNSVKSIKYICKYINKGSDQAVFAIQNQYDEISRYEAGRYISSSEAAWRIFRFPVHERYPPVVHLAVHLENGQRIYFTECNVVNKVRNPPQTTLLAFFDLCKRDDFAKQLHYNEIPSYYVWNNNMFCRRKQGKTVPGHSGVKRDNVLGRIYTVHPKNSECYHLRLLLNEIKGPTSFQCLRTVGGVLHPTYKSACRALGLLQDDINWDETLQEAALSRSPQMIRELFGVMLVFCQMENPLSLWEKHKDSLAEDVWRQTEREQKSKNGLI